MAARTVFMTGCDALRLRALHNSIASPLHLLRRTWHMMRTSWRSRPTSPFRHNGALPLQTDEGFERDNEPAECVQHGWIPVAMRLMESAVAWIANARKPLFGTRLVAAKPPGLSAVRALQLHFHASAKSVVSESPGI